MRSDTEIAAVATAMMESNPWEQIKARLATRVSSQAYQNWVMRTAFEGLSDGTLRVAVPDQVTKDWMEHEYADDIRAAIRELSLPVDNVIYVPAVTSMPIAAAENGST